MEISMIELSKYRFKQAQEILEDAKILLNEKSFASSDIL